MFGLTVYRYLEKRYTSYMAIGIAPYIYVFLIWILFEIIRNIGQYGLSAPGEFRFRYLILVLPIYIALNFNTFESRKKLEKLLIVVSYFIPLFYIPVIGMMKGWAFGESDRFLNSQIYLGMVYSIMFIFLSSKYNYIKFNKNIIFLSLIPFSFFFIIDSHRSAWLAVAVILMLLFYLNEFTIGKYMKIITFTLLIGAVLTWSFNYSGLDLSKYIEKRGSAFVTPSDDPTSEWRLIMWSAQLETFAESPILGKGFGGYWTVVFPNGETVNISPHSYYIQTLVKLGIVGMTLWLIIALKIFTILKKFLKNAKSKYNTELPLVISGFCVIITMHVYYIIYSLEYYSLIYLGLAVGVILDKKYYLNES